MAVVKADGYGHGAVPVATAALAAGASWLGVCTLEEAAELRDAGITAPVLSWLHLPDEDFSEAVATGVDVSAGVAGAPRRRRSRVPGARAARRALHLKADTGLSRNGAQPAGWADLLDDAEKAAADGYVRGRGGLVAPGQRRRPGTPHPRRAGGPPHRGVARPPVSAVSTPIRHLANSAATLTRPDLHFDLVRPGIAVYGLDPLGRPAAESPLRPAMTLRGRVALVKRVPAGEGVSYGHEWTTSRDTTLALVPIGYADGVPRRLGRDGRMRVLLGGALRPVVGRVCMDQVVVDCGDGNGVREGDQRCCSVPVTTASPPPRTGRTSSAPSTTRSSPACTAGASARTYTGIAE